MNSSLIQKIVFFIVFMGVFLRLGEYLSNRSLWADEAVVADRVAKIPIMELAQIKPVPAERSLSYPIGFLLSEKIAMQVFGNNEYAVRLVPLIVSILSLILFINVSMRFLGEGWGCVAVFFFALSRDLIYFSSEAKPYALDVFFCVCLLYIFLKFVDTGFSKEKYIGLMLFGLAAVYFSFPAVFMLASFVFLLGLLYVKERNRNFLIVFSGSAFFWGLAFGIYYFFSLRHLGAEENLQEYWKSVFFPLTLDLVSVGQWLVIVFKKLFTQMLQYPPGLAGVLFVIGIYSFFEKEKKYFVLLTLPIILTMTASALKMYPFAGRLVLFLTPIVILFITQGIKTLSFSLSAAHARFTASVFIIFMMFFPVLYTYKQAAEVSGVEEIKPLMQYISEHKKPGDIIAVDSGSLAAFSYYSEKYGLRAEDIFVLTREHVLSGLQNNAVPGELLNQPRVWLLVTHIRRFENQDERKFVVAFAEKVGRKLDEYLIQTDPYSTSMSYAAKISSYLYLYSF